MKTLHSQGYNVAIHYGHSEHAAQQLAEQLNEQRLGSAAIFKADLCQPESAEQLAKHVLIHFGQCDLLVNNASTFYSTPLGTISTANWDDLFASNAKAPLLLCQALASNLKAQRGNIINIADIHAHRPLALHTVYCMAKAANIMMTQSLALEFAPEVRVNGIAPGAILWPEDEAGNEVVQHSRLQNIPLKSLGGTQAIADAVSMLCQSDYITGHILNVDGGKTLLQ